MSWLRYRANDSEAMYVCVCGLREKRGFNKIPGKHITNPFFRIITFHSLQNKFESF